MSKQLYTYLYRGATREDVYAEQDGNNYNIDLELLATPQCAFVAPEYSEQLVEELARDMWADIAEFYAGSLDRPFATRAPFEALRVVTASTAIERPENFNGPLPIKEVVSITYYGEADFHNETPLIQIVVQVRPVRLPSKPKTIARRVAVGLRYAPGG